MKRRTAASALASLALGSALILGGCGAPPMSAETRDVPRFEVDPSWPKLPPKWVFGQGSAESIDGRGHAWILQRPSTVRADQKDRVAPPVLNAVLGLGPVVTRAGSA